MQRQSLRCFGQREAFQQHPHFGMRARGESRAGKCIVCPPRACLTRRQALRKAAQGRPHALSSPEKQQGVNARPYFRIEERLPGKSPQISGLELYLWNLA
jgi:hypothetical protein